MIAEPFQAGDTIVMYSGNYEDVFLWFDKQCADRINGDETCRACPGRMVTARHISHGDEPFCWMGGTGSYEDKPLWKKVEQ